MESKYRTLMLKDAERLELEIKKKKKRIAKLPRGNLSCCYDKGRYRWVMLSSETDDTGKSIRRRKYLKKAEHKLASSLAYRTYLEKQIEDDEKELKAIKQYLRLCVNASKADEYMKRNPELMSLLAPYTIQWDVNSADWVNNKTERKNNIPNDNPLVTKSGEFARSKGELIICDRLYERGIPYKLEQAIDARPAYYLIDELGLQYSGPRYPYLFPDITVLSKNRGEIIWEHMGMMDKPEYVQHCCDKLLIYSLLGYKPFKNFIMTFETNGRDFDAAWLDKIIDYYLIN